MKSSEWTGIFLCGVLSAAQFLSPDFPFYLILLMTDCALFKLPVTFPLCKLLHFKILIGAELPVTSWFPLIAEAAAGMKEGGTSLRGGQGVKLHNRLFVWAFSLWFPDLVGVQKDVSSAQQAAIGSTQGQGQRTPTADIWERPPETISRH